MDMEIEPLLSNMAVGPLRHCLTPGTGSGRSGQDGAVSHLVSRDVSWLLERVSVAIWVGHDRPIAGLRARGSRPRVR